MNSHRQRVDILVFGEGDDSFMPGSEPMKAMIIVTIICQNRPTQFRRPGQYFRIVDFLIGPAIFNCSQNIVADPTQLMHQL